MSTMFTPPATTPSATPPGDSTPDLAHSTTDADTGVPSRRVFFEASASSGDPRWARPALMALLAATGLLYLWGLGASGWANSFYSAAAQAGSESWKAWFFGSLDSANAITVDKPPMALWIMGLSTRVFGVNPWSILVPQALAGVASVALLYATVKRWFSSGAGLLAGAVLATTPVAALMFRFNNPDALLVLILIGSVWCMVRALETTATRWVVATWALVGCAFLTKMLQALMVAPALALVYLILADTPLRRRFTQSIAGFVSLVVSAGWYVAVVELWPASSRPYIGGSQHNSLLELTLGYNGLGRLTGNETGSANNGGMWGATGWNRLFNGEFGSQASWLIPAALIALIAGLWWTWRRPRTDLQRAALIIWGGWLLVTAAAFSFGQGIIHPYYTVALAPAVGALVGMGAHLAAERRHTWFARIILALAIAATAWWGHVLLGRSGWMSWLAPTVLVAGVVCAVLILAAPSLRGTAGAAIAAAAVVVALAGPAAYSVQTASTTHTGALPSAGPNQSGRFGQGGGRGPGGFGGRRAGGAGNFTPPQGGFGGNGIFGGRNRVNGLRPPGGFGGIGPSRGGAGGRGASAGGLLDGSTSSPEITAMLTKRAGDFRWVAAAVGSNSAAGFQLASGKPVMAIGGFNGSDPYPTLAQFKAYVDDGDIHYFIGSGHGFGFGGRGPGGGGRSLGSSDGEEISSWVSTHFTSTTVDGVIIYDLTKPTSSTTG